MTDKDTGESKRFKLSDDQMMEILNREKAQQASKSESGDPLSSFSREFRALLPLEKRKFNWTEKELLRLQFFFDTLNAKATSKELDELVARAIMNFDVLKTITQDDEACFHHLDEKSPLSPKPNEWRSQLLARLNWEIHYFSDLQNLRTMDREIKTWLVRAQKKIMNSDWDQLPDRNESERFWKASEKTIRKLKQVDIALEIGQVEGPYRKDWMDIFEKWKTVRELLRQLGYAT